MRCAIMQPYFFPWAGYISLISQVDTFVFLDDAQFAKSSWHHRCRILQQGQPLYLTLPVKRHSLGQGICEIDIDQQQEWRKKHLRTIEQSYSKAPRRADVLALHGALENVDTRALVDLDIESVVKTCEALGIGRTFLRSSALGILGRRTERLIRILESLDCETYMSPPGSRGYLEEDDFVGNCKIALKYNEFVPAPYDQVGKKEFLPGLSILDVVANLGFAGAADYVRI